MNCPFCDHPKSHKHGKTSKGSQRFRCAECHRTSTDTLDTLYYRRQVTPAQVEVIAEGSSLRGLSSIGKRAYGTVVDIVRKASDKGQLGHNEAVANVDCDQVIADEMWSFVKKAEAVRDPQVSRRRLLVGHQSGPSEWFDIEPSGRQTH